MFKAIDIYLQIYNIELWQEFKFLLLNNNLQYNKLYIALTEGQINNIIIEDIQRYSNCYYDIFPNKGGDIGQFLRQLDIYANSSTADSILKIHSKKSILQLESQSSQIFMGYNKYLYNWWPSSFNWRADLLYKLMGNKEIFNDNCDLLHQYNIGMIFPYYSNFDEGESGHIIEILLETLFNIKYSSVKNSIFPAGSMFFIRSDILKKYFTTKIIENLYDNMPVGPIIEGSNGSICHAIERILGYCVTDSNFRIRPI